MKVQFVKKLINNTRKSLIEVYKQFWYGALTFLFALLLIILNILLPNYRLLFSDFSLNEVWLLLFSGFSNIPPASFIVLILISALGGMTLSFMAYLLRRQAGFSTAGPLGILASILIPACPSCAIGVIPFLGLGGFLSTLPFKGLAFSIIGIAILVASILFMSGKIVAASCEIPRKNKPKQSKRDALP